MDHLENYFDMSDTTLIKTTDDLCENIHQNLEKRLMHSFYKVKDVLNSSHGDRLCRAVKHLNAYNMNIGIYSHSSSIYIDLNYISFM